MHTMNLREKFATFSEHWSPRIVAELNGQHVKLVKFRGEFVWHHHDGEDELFLVHRGRFRMEFATASSSWARRDDRRSGGVEHTSGGEDDGRDRAVRARRNAQPR